MNDNTILSEPHFCSMAHVRMIAALLADEWNELRNIRGPAADQAREDLRLASEALRRGDAVSCIYYFMQEAFCRYKLRRIVCNKKGATTTTLSHP